MRRPISTLKTQNSKSCFLILSFTLCVLHLFAGCIQKGDLNKAQNYAQESKEYYQRAVSEYKDLIKNGQDLDKLYFELGKLYYDYGEFIPAEEVFGESNQPEAKKFLAITYYRLGNFTDALEIFNKTEILDDEYLYYHGLTCEKLNLFDRALEIYGKIKEKRFATLALAQINLIEKQAHARKIKEIDPKVYKIIQASPGENLYPEAGALILSCDESIEITPENIQVATLHYMIKILNERGKEDFSETQIEYDSTDEKVELIYARTIKPDGTVTDVGSRHIRDVSKYLNFPLYSNVRVYIISFPEITEGAVIEYKIKIYDNQLVNKKDFVLSYPLQAQEPIINANFTIDLPKDRTLQIKTYNEKYNYFAANLNPQIQERNGKLIYLWQFKNLPQIIPESNMPQEEEINPTIMVSTFNSWQEIYQWWWGLAKDKIKIDKAIKAKVKELIKKKDSPEAKIRTIYNFLTRQIRYVAVEYGQAGYEPHSATDIFKNKYGDCKDQAILLVTMLKEAGLVAWPVLIPTKDSYNLDLEFPSLFFDHCIVAIPFKERVVFLDPTAETCSFDDLPPDDQMRRVLIFQEDKYEIKETPLYPAQHNLIKQELKLKINSDETMVAQRDIFSFGMYDQGQRYWLLYTPPKLIEEALKEKIQDVSIGANLIKYEIKNLEDLNMPVILNYSFYGPEYFTVAGNLRIMPQLSSVDVSVVAKNKRQYPIDFGILDMQQVILEIEIPDNFVIRYIPPVVNEDSPWFNFRAEYSVKAKRLIFKQKQELKKNTVKEEEYPQFKTFFENLAKKIKQRVVLEKIK